MISARIRFEDMKEKANPYQAIKSREAGLRKKAPVPLAEKPGCGLLRTAAEVAVFCMQVQTKKRREYYRRFADGICRSCVYLPEKGPCSLRNIIDDYFDMKLGQSR